jgi:hypothetical protein
VGVQLSTLKLQLVNIEVFPLRVLSTSSRYAPALAGAWPATENVPVPLVVGAVDHTV